MNQPPIKHYCITCRYYGENNPIKVKVKTVCANAINNLGSIEEKIYPFIKSPQQCWCSLYYEVE